MIIECGYQTVVGLHYCTYNKYYINITARTCFERFLGSFLTLGNCLAVGLPLCLFAMCMSSHINIMAL